MNALKNLVLAACSLNLIVQLGVSALPTPTRTTILDDAALHFVPAGQSVRQRDGGSPDRYSVAVHGRQLLADGGTLKVEEACDLSAGEEAAAKILWVAAQRCLADSVDP